MHKPQINHLNEELLQEIVNGERSINFEFLAANILTQHIQNLYSKEPSEENLHKFCSRLKRLLLENADLPSVKKDLRKINSLER